MTTASLARSAENFLITETVGVVATPLVNVSDVASIVAVYGDVLMAAMLFVPVGGHGQVCGAGQNVEPQLSTFAVPALTVEFKIRSIPAAPPTRSAVMRAP